MFVMCTFPTVQIRLMIIVLSDFHDFRPARNLSCVPNMFQEFPRIAVIFFPPPRPPPELPGEPLGPMAYLC